MWKHSPQLEDINAANADTACAALQITVTEVGADFIRGTMPVNERTRQPLGLLHGGASVLLAETLGSIAGNLCVDDGHMAVGLEINANHVRAISAGEVTGTARPLHVGRNTQVWDIRIEDEAQRLLCVSRLTLAVIARPASA